MKTLPLWVLSGAYYLTRRFWLRFDDATAFFKTANAYADHASTRVYTALAALPGTPNCWCGRTICTWTASSGVHVAV